jgi:hypothetical protein
MSRLVTVFTAGVFVAAFVSGGAMLAAAAPTSDADKAAMKDATAKCRAQIKEQARFEEMSLWARHKAVKKCVHDSLAGH